MLLHLLLLTLHCHTKGVECLKSVGYNLSMRDGWHSIHFHWQWCTNQITCTQGKLHFEWEGAAMMHTPPCCQQLRQEAWKIHWMRRAAAAGGGRERSSRLTVIAPHLGPLALLPPITNCTLDPTQCSHEQYWTTAERIATKGLLIQNYYQLIEQRLLISKWLTRNNRKEKKMRTWETTQAVVCKVLVSTYSEVWTMYIAQ